MIFKFFITSLIITVSACSNSPKTAQIIEQPQTNARDVVSTPTPFLGQKAKVQGENLPTKFAENFETSIKQQDPPNLWLEFNQANGETVKYDLSNKIKEKLKVDLDLSLSYKNVHKYSKNADERTQAEYNLLTEFNDLRNALRKLKIDSPDGKRKLTEDEIEEIFSVQTDLVIERFDELDKHFNREI